MPRHEFEASDPSRLVREPEVSVGIITYNHQRYLADALNSVLAQRTSFPYEIVVYEDCSTDGTREIALEYQRRHPELIRVLYSSSNAGMARNAQRGIAAYRGRYSAGLDGDDIWTDPSKLQAQFDALEANSTIDLCFSQAAVIFSDDSREGGWNYGKRDRVVSRRELLKTPGMVVPTSTLFFRTRVLHESPDWIFASPVIDVFHLMAGVSPNGAWYLARETAAYRAMTEGSWSHSQAADYDRTKIRHSERMLEAWDLAAKTFAIPSSELGLMRGLPHYVLARDALANRRYRLALWHMRRIGRSFPLVRLKQLLGIRSRTAPPGP